MAQRIDVRKLSSAVFIWGAHANAFCFLAGGWRRRSRPTCAQGRAQAAGAKRAVTPQTKQEGGRGNEEGRVGKEEEGEETEKEEQERAEEEEEQSIS